MGAKMDPQMGAKWSQNALRRRCRGGVLVRMRSGLHFGFNFHRFLNCLGINFRYLFWSSYLVNAKCECSESPHFYNGFWRFYWSDEIRKSSKMIWKMTGVALILCACERPQKSIQKAIKNRSKMDPKSIKKRCWKPCKSVFSFGGLLESPKIDFLTIFDPNMAPKGSQNGPQNQWKIGLEATWPLGRAPRRSKDPPRTLRDPILDRFWTPFSTDFI